MDANYDHVLLGFMLLPFVAMIGAFIGIFAMLPVQDRVAPNADNPLFVQIGSVVSMVTVSALFMCFW